VSGIRDCHKGGFRINSWDWKKLASGAEGPYGRLAGMQVDEKPQKKVT